MCPLSYLRGQCFGGRFNSHLTKTGVASSQVQYPDNLSIPRKKSVFSIAFEAANVRAVRCRWLVFGINRLENGLSSLHLDWADDLPAAVSMTAKHFCRLNHSKPAGQTRKEGSR